MFWGKKVSFSVFFCCLVIGIYFLIQPYIFSKASSSVRFFMQSLPQEKISPPESALFEFQAAITLSESALAGEPAGTVFTLNLPDLHCAAGFVNAQQSRVYTNQNNLEFWCKDMTQAEPDLAFISIGRLNANITQSSIANVGNVLFDDRSQAIYSFEHNKWTSLTSTERALIQDGQLLTIQFRKGKAFIIYYKSDTGIGIVSQDGYHGSITHEDFSSFSAIYTDGKSVYANLGGKMYTGELLPGKLFTKPEPIELSLIEEAEGWLYTLYPYHGTLLYGGSGENAQLHSIRNNRLGRSLPLLKGRLPTTEIYSMSPFNEALLVGTYPDGRVMSLYDDMGSVTWTTFVNIESARAKKLTEESQAVLASYGKIFTGMYPWGTLHQYDSLREQEIVCRLYTWPEVVPGEYPLECTLADHFLNVIEERFGVRYESMRVVPDEILRTMRAEGRWDRKWHQRVPSVVVLNGKLCASTGNFGGEPYIADYDTLFPQEQAAQYGDVHCATLPNHTLLGPLESMEPGLYTFRVSTTHMSILKNGMLLTAVPHSLSGEALRVLQSHETLPVITGKGFYGPLNGTVDTLRKTTQ